MDNFYNIIIVLEIEKGRKEGKKGRRKERRKKKERRKMLINLFYEVSMIIILKFYINILRKKIKD